MEPNELDEELDEQEELDEENIVCLTDEEGQEVPCELLDSFEYRGACYYVMLPLDDEAGGVVILRGTDDENLEPVEDDGEAEAVFAQFRARNEEKFAFEEPASLAGARTKTVRAPVFCAF